MNRHRNNTGGAVILEDPPRSLRDRLRSRAALRQHNRPFTTQRTSDPDRRPTQGFSVEQRHQANTLLPNI